MADGNQFSPTITRSAVMLGMASALTRDIRWLNSRAKVILDAQGGGVPPITLFGCDSHEMIPAVARGEVELAIVNPAGPLTLAHRGTGPFKEPLPVRLLAMIPSRDAFAFALRGDCPVQSLEEVRDRRYPLRVSVRGQRDHSDHFMIDLVLGALGFSTRDIESWGGSVSYDPGLPLGHGISRAHPTAVPRLERLRRGEIDAIFDEGLQTGWAEAALKEGMRILPLQESLVAGLEAMGWRRHVLLPEDFAGLPEPTLTMDFSGFPIYTHAGVPDEIITRICAALDAAAASIPHENQIGIPIREMCTESPAAPLDVPFHPAAERYWQEQGYR